MHIWSRTSPLIPCIQPLTQKIDVSDSRVVIRLLEHQHTPCSFQVTCVNTHKIVYVKEVAFLVWIHNSSIVSRTYFYLRD